MNVRIFTRRRENSLHTHTKQSSASRQNSLDISPNVFSTLDLCKSRFPAFRANRRRAAVSCVGRFLDLHSHIPVTRAIKIKNVVTLSFAINIAQRNSGNERRCVCVCVYVCDATNRNRLGVRLMTPSTQRTVFDDGSSRWTADVLIRKWKMAQVCTVF